jgi:hypothetical protein
MSNDEKLDILDHLWIPNVSYNFPKSGKRNLKFQHSWLYEFKWLAYSDIEDGAYCKICIFFPSPNICVGKGSHEATGRLVLDKYDHWKNAKEDFKKHEKTDYHKFNQLQEKNVLSIKEKKTISIDLQLNEAKKKEVLENRKKILPIIKTVLLCGRQGLALRGHFDHGLKSLQTKVDNSNKDDKTLNEGNFRALLKFRIDAGDCDLENHLNTASKNATYISPRVQNEIISSCNNIILKKLVDQINNAECFALLADETMDVSTKEQLSICIRYFDDGEKKIREDFLQFVQVNDVSGKGLADTILESISSFGINPKFMIGQGYDGAAAMSGQFKGVQTRIREIYPLAYYIHCSAHCLNLVISDSCNIPEIRNTIGTMQSICNFFGYPKRLEVLQRCIKDLFPSSKASRLKQMCPTRWVQRHDAVILYEEMQLAVVSALEILSNNSSTGFIEEYSWISSNISSQADQLLCAIKKLQFQVSLYVLTKVLSISVGLSRSLQLENSDLKTALDAASCVENLIEQLRINSENEFMKLFETVKKTCEQIGISDFSLPRKINRQKTRNNVPAENVEQHFLRSIFIPFLDTFLLQLRERLTSHNTILKNFSCLIPKTKNPSKEQEKSFIDLHETYSSFINKSKLMTAEEFKLWYTFVEQNEMNPKSPIDALITCDKILFPTIYLLLKILVTLPITTSSAERSFSTLRRLKTYLRNTISESRLNGLALLNIHTDISVLPEEVLNHLVKYSNRRLNLRLNL